MLQELVGIQCTGCSACYSACPVGAIEMIEDVEGFKFPTINKEKCTNCGLCKKTCPILNQKFDNLKKPKSYAYMANDRFNSASGGAFYTLAKYFIENNGYVAGVVWEKDWSIKHIVSNNIKDIENMRDSKYFQSSINGCFKETKELLKQNKKVLFTGTPCQIAGLKAYLKRDYSNLYSIDIICHGVPSPKVFKKYLNENYDIDKIQEIKFRDKSQNGWGATLKIKTIEKEYYAQYPENEFYKLFFTNSILRKCCGDCQFNKLPRQGDLTIGDFWGVNEQYDDKMGTSVVLSNSKKGKKLINILSNNSKLFKEVSLKATYKMNKNIIKTSRIDYRKRALFFENMDKMSLNKNCKSLLDNGADCMILNFWPCANYGAVLTCWGTQLLIEGLNKNVKVINYVPQIGQKYEKSLSKKFADKYFNLTQPVKDYKDFIDLNKNCNTFIVGPDQVFNDNISKTHHSNASRYIYLLDFVKSGNKRISYSASFGAITFQGDEIDKQHFDYNIKKFDAISIREDEGCELLKREFGLNSIRLIDGAFHISKEKLEEITKEYKTEEKYIAIFVFPIYKKEAWYKELVQKIQEKLNISIKEYNGKTVEEWLSYIKNAQFVIAGSYHAIVFSIIFNVPFVQIKSDLHAQSRFTTLFRMLNIKDNTISRYDKNYNWNDLYVERNWKEINSLIEKEKNIAKKWVENALKKEVVNNKESDISNLIRYEIEIAKNEKPVKKTGFIRLKYNLIKILIALSFGKTKNKLKQEKEKLVHLFKKGIM